MRLLPALIAFVVVVVVVVGGGCDVVGDVLDPTDGCVVDSTAGLERCSRGLEFQVGGEGRADGAVDVEVDDAAEAVSLVIVSDPDSVVGTIRVELSTVTASEIDAPRGTVQARWGRAFAGEGSEVGYVELVDDAGLFFAGGREQIEDDRSTGSSVVDGRLSVGATTGVLCNGSSQDDNHTEAHFARFALDGGDVDLGVGDRASGTVDGVGVIAVGAGAGETVFFADEEALDGYGAGCHTFAGASGFVVRAAVDE